MTWQRSRTLVHFTFLAAWLAALLPVAAFPHRVLADDLVVAGEDATSADAAEEIVYLDNNGTIRVLDTSVPAGGVAVDWTSPEADWRSFALGDFNNDGDLEIVGVKGSGASDSKLVIWDPVISKGATAADPKTSNGIPWRKLYETPLGNKPDLVAAANFDTGVPGDEILFVRRLGTGDTFDPGDQTRLTIIKQTSATPDGTAWQNHIERKDFENLWSSMYAGPLDTTGAAEWALVDEDQGKLEVYTLDGGYHRILDDGATNKPIESVVFAQFIAGGNNELAYSRDIDPPLSSLIVKSYENGGFTGDVYQQALNPNFAPIFAGDINGSGDDELILLRTGTDVARLIVRNDGSDGIVQGFVDGLPLDTDNGYRAGAAGDIDGDSRDEILVMRDNKIRTFPDANVSTISLDYSLATNRRNVVTGDLDRNGFSAGAQFGASVSQINDTAFVGYPKEGTFTLSNVTTEDGIPFNAFVEGNPLWLTVTPFIGVAPGKGSGVLQMTYLIRSEFMTAGQTYTATIQIAATDPAQKVSNSPFRLPISVRAETPPLTATPPGSGAIFMPCQEPLPERTLQFQVKGVNGAVFKAEVVDDTQLRGLSAEGGLYWGDLSSDGGLRLSSAGDARASETVVLAPASLAATDAVTWTSHVPFVTEIRGVTNTVPAQISLTISPTLRSSDMDRAVLLLMAPAYTGPNDLVIRAYPIWAVCTDTGSWLPLLGKP